MSLEDYGTPKAISNASYALLRGLMGFDLHLDGYGSVDGEMAASGLAALGIITIEKNGYAFTDRFIKLLNKAIDRGEPLSL